MLTLLRRLLASVPRSPRRRPLRLEALEERTVPSLFATGGVVNPPTLDVPSSGVVYTANASSRNGLSVVVWSQKNGATGSDLCAQTYNTDHTPLGGKIQVTAGTVDDVSPSVSMANNGNWVVSWTRLLSGGDQRVYAKRFSSFGAPLGSTLTVATNPGVAIENSSSVACDGKGDFVVAYTRQPRGSSNMDVYASLYLAGGSILDTIAVADNSHFVQQSPAVARSTSSNDGFSIAYAIGKNIRMKTYNGGGFQTGNYVIADNGHTNALPAVARDDAGDSVVAWQLLTPSTDPNSALEGYTDWNIDARRVSAAGVVGRITRIVSGSAVDFGGGEGTFDNYTTATVAMKPSGTAFVVGSADNHWDDQDGPITSVHIVEVNSRGKIRGTNDINFHLPSKNWNPAPSLSINAQGAYFLSFFVLSDSSLDPEVRWRLGRLS